jgi:hypothetical protein
VENSSIQAGDLIQFHGQTIEIVSVSGELCFYVYTEPYRHSPIKVELVKINALLERGIAVNLSDLDRLIFR